MALINCAECQKEVSDQAKACVHCGAPLVRATPSMKASDDMEFRNPSTGEIINIKNGAVWSLIFGVFYFLYKKVLNWALIAAVLAFLTVGISWVILPFFTNKILQKHFIKEGFTQIK